MTAHPRIFDPGPATLLTDRQQQVLELLQQHPAGLRSTDVGWYLHMGRNAPCACSASTPTASTTCRWAKSDGDRVATQLRRLDPPLAIKRRSGLWQALVRPAEGAGELPEGY